MLRPYGERTRIGLDRLIALGRAGSGRLPIRLTPGAHAYAFTFG